MGVNVWNVIQDIMTFLNVKVTCVDYFKNKSQAVLETSNISACNCNNQGATSSECNTNGTCSCKPNVIGKKCIHCKLGYYDFPDCKGTSFKSFHSHNSQYHYTLDCDCNNQGSTSEECNSSGNCFCKLNVIGSKCIKCDTGYYGFPHCKGRFVFDNFNDSSTSLEICNILACYCNKQGSTSTQCNIDGKCYCKSDIIGNKCTDCKTGYYDFPECKSKFIIL